MDIKDIKDLILTLDKTGIQRVEIEQEDIKLMISKEVSGKEKPRKNYHEDDYIIREDKSTSQIEDIEEDGDFFFVKSPIVGVYYGASSPESDRFVKAGDKVEKGQTLCIIEAMKIMNEIECEVPGEIVEVYVKDEDLIQYGQSLMKIRR